MYASYFQFCNLQEKVTYFIGPLVTMSIRIHIRVRLFNAKNFELQIFCAHDSRKAYLLHTSTPLPPSVCLSVFLFLFLSLSFSLFHSFSLSLFLSFSLSLFLSFSLSLFLSFSLSIFLSPYLSFSISLFLSLSLNFLS